MTTTPKDRWQSSTVAHHYARARWNSKRKASRDPRLIQSLLDAHPPSSASGQAVAILDAPCGTGRLRGMLTRNGAAYFGVDVSTAMLRECESATEASLFCGDLNRLPFRSASFDVVVCCRLLHHLEDHQEFQRVMDELVRVSSGLIVASFWDAASLPALRRRHFPSRAGHARNRVAYTKTFIRNALDHAGADWLEARHSLRFFSRQTLFVARKRR